MSNNNEKNIILINKMYTGSYLDDNNGNNIGHEIINFFKAEDGSNYIYITPYGKYKHGDRIQYVLFTTQKIDGKYEIIAKAEIEEEYKVSEETEIEESKNSKYILKESYREKHNDQALKIKYGGKSIYDIYKDNINNDEAIYASFKVKKIYKVKDGVTIKVNLNSTKNNKEDKTVVTVSKNGKKRSEAFKHQIIPEIKNGNKQNKIKIPLNIGMSSTIYLDPNDNDKNKVKLAEYFKNIIDNKSLWKEEEVSEIKISEQEKQENRKFNFLNLIQKEYDENIFTNLLAYYFNVKYKENEKEETDIILNKFLNWLSTTDKKFKEKYTYDSNVKFSEISNEHEIAIKKNKKKDEEKSLTNSENISKGRIDLFASKDDIYLVIENKIKSKINGKQENGYQLKFYKSAIEKKYTNSKFIGIILVPDYSKELIKNEKGYKDVENDYIIVTYKKLYNFFTEEIKKDMLNDENARKYYEDFNNALYIHTLSAKTKEENKFKKAILDAKEIKYTVFVARFKKCEEELEYKYYIGTTTNLDRRKLELSETNKFKKYKIDNFIWFKEYGNLNEAIEIEKELEKRIIDKLENENKILEKVDILKYM